MVDDVLHDEHSLRTSKATECSVGGEVGTTDETLNVHIGDIVCVSGVECSTLSHLRKEHGDHWS